MPWRISQKALPRNNIQGWKIKVEKENWTQCHNVLLFCNSSVIAINVFEMSLKIIIRIIIIMKNLWKPKGFFSAFHFWRMPILWKRFLGTEACWKGFSDLACIIFIVRDSSTRAGAWGKCNHAGEPVRNRDVLQASFYGLLWWSIHISGKGKDPKGVFVDAVKPLTQSLTTSFSLN